MAEHGCAGRRGWRCGLCVVAGHNGFSPAGSGTPRSTSASSARVSPGSRAQTRSPTAASRATVYEAGTRVGGRCISLRNLFPGQVAERGGEFIDTPHKTMLGYARRFGLALEDVSKEPGDVFYHFGGQHIPESAVVDEFRDFVQVMRAGSPEAVERGRRRSPTQTLTWRSIARASLAYLGRRKRRQPRRRIDRKGGDRRGLHRRVRPRARRAELPELPRSSSTPIGARSSRRSASSATSDTTCSMATIASSHGLAQALPRPVELGMMLSAVRETAGGRIELTFETPGGARIAHARCGRPRDPVHHAARRRADVNLDRVPGKRAAIDLLGYGTNAKMMVGFERAALDPSGRQRHGVRRSRESPVHLGNESRKRDVRSRRADRLLGRRSAVTSLDPGAVQLEAEPVPRGSQPGVSRRACRGAAREGERRRTPRALAFEPAGAAAATPATCPASSRRWPDSRGCLSETCSSPASTRIRSTSGRASWKARRYQASMPPRRF